MDIVEPQFLEANVREPSQILQPRVEAEQCHPWKISTNGCSRRRNTDFLDCGKEGNQLLWVSGGPGRGKAMILTTIVSQLSGQAHKCHSRSLYYFFRGKQQTRIRQYRSNLEEPDLVVAHTVTISKETPLDPNDLFALSAVFYDMMQDGSLLETCLVVDAIDWYSVDGGAPGLERPLTLDNDVNIEGQMANVM